MKWTMVLLGLVCMFLCLFVPLATGDSSSNDSFENAEPATATTYTGNVSILSDEYDYYIITIPADKDINITLTQASEGSIAVHLFKSDTTLLYSFALSTDRNGESASESWWNSGDAAMDAYIRVQGDGDYRIAIKFTNDSSEAVEGILAICGGTILCLVLGFVGFILLIVLIIVLIIWRVKKRKQAPMNNPSTAHQPSQNAGQTRSYPQGQPQPQQYPQGQQPAGGQPQYQSDPNVPQYRPDPDRPQPQVFEQGQGTMGQPPR